MIVITIINLLFYSYCKKRSGHYNLNHTRESNDDATQARELIHRVE